MHNFIVYISPITINQCKKKNTICHIFLLSGKKKIKYSIYFNWLIDHKMKHMDKRFRFAKRTNVYGRLVVVGLRAFWLFYGLKLKVWLG